MSKVTIQDIADALGISRNTVSKAINNSEGLADATREKILQKAVEMGYKQFSYVNSLARITPDSSSPDSTPGYAGEIALLTTTFLSLSHFASIMLDKFQQEISQLGYTLNLHRVDEQCLKNKTLPITFVKSRVKAILCIEMFNWDYDKMICELGLPVLFIDGPCRMDGKTLPADQLCMCNTTEITKLILYLLGKGKKRIGFIGDYKHCQSFYERYTAFRMAMLMAGETVEESFIIRHNDVQDLEVRLNALTEYPDAFLCANDFVAMDAMRILRAAGKQIPEDILFSGFDDSPESRIITPTLTTIHIHTQVMAFAAVDLLMSRIKEPSLDFRVVHTQSDLILRESTETER
ncbi:MAG: LacI family transcriptional regulator [Lachnospiraceae bacterium]|nr:LacI family transcriptional regulator [Lachnospiraceae bacterium]